MNITEHPHHARPIKCDGSGGVRRIQPDVERLAVIVRKRIVKDEIAVGEIHRGSQRDGQHVRREGFVLLQHFRVVRRAAAATAPETGSSQTTTPE